MPLHWPQASVHWSPFLLHVFFPQLTEQLHQTIFGRKAGAEACSIRFGLRNLPSLILQMTHPQSVANNMSPNQACTWW